MIAKPRKLYLTMIAPWSLCFDECSGTSYHDESLEEMKVEVKSIFKRIKYFLILLLAYVSFECSIRRLVLSWLACQLLEGRSGTLFITDSKRSPRPGAWHPQTFYILHRYNPQRTGLWHRHCRRLLELYISSFRKSMIATYCFLIAALHLLAAFLI